MTSTFKTDELLQLSRQMLKAAGDQAWEQVQEFEAARERLLSGYNAAAELVLGREHVEASLKEMLDINQRILEWSVQARDDVKANLETLQRGIKAGHAYRQNE